MAENPIALAETQGPDASRRPSPFVLPALAGAVGAGLLALAGDLPGSPYGPHAGGLWPWTATGSAPGWEGPKVPSWADVADQGPGVGPGRLLVILAVIAGVGLLGLAWITLWRRARAEPHRGRRHLWWVVGAWTAPLLFAAPLASQDVWLSGAQGKMVLGGFGGYRPASLLGHSVWTLAVDPKWAARPSFYGPGSLDLSALFVKISGGRPWVAAECWRVTAILGLVLCAWGVGRIVSRRGGDATPATLAAVANPAMLIVLVAGIHNDALMLGLIVAGTALAVSQSRASGMVLCALGVAIKPNALLAAGALAWWAWGTRWRHRTRGALAAATAVIGVLVVTGFGLSEGFGWFTVILHDDGLPGPWSLGPQLLGARSGLPVAVIAGAGLALAVALVVGARRPGASITGLGWGFVAVAVTNPKPEPWYLAWAVVFLACGGLHRRSERIGVLLLSLMMASSLLPLSVLWWFEGLVGLVVLGVLSVRTRLKAPAPPPDELSERRVARLMDDYVTVTRP